MAINDVTIRGAGIFGLSIAWACRRRGARVALVDPNGAAHGASGGVVGALAPHVPENWNAKKQAQFESLIMAESFWADVDEVSGLSSGYARTGRYQPVATERQLAHALARSESARTLWQGKARWQVLDRNPRPGWAPESPTGHWIFDSLTARMSPRAAAASLVRALEIEGVPILSEAPEAGRTIWATGVAGLADLSRDLGQEVGNAVKGQSALLAHDAGELPQVFADGVHVIPHEDGTTAIGSTSEREFESADGCDAQLEALLSKARGLVPALAGAQVLSCWAGLRPRARSRAPMLGPWPGRNGHFVANGGFKIGFGMAPYVAEIMADLVLEEQDEFPPDFRVEASLY